MQSKHTIIQPVSREGLIAPPQILVTKTVWQQLWDMFFETTRNLLAILGLILVISWMF